MRFPVLLLALLAAGPARADEAKPTVAATPEACAALMAGAAYVPAVDVNGNAVAPADLPREPSAVSTDTLSIEIDPTLAGQYGIPAAGTGAYGTRPILGYVTVTNGRAYLNGKPLAPEASDALAAACTAARK